MAPPSSAAGDLIPPDGIDYPKQLDLTPTSSGRDS
jgi:hypothetical protein